MGNKISKSAKQGVVLLVFGKIFSRSLSFLATIFLARKLEPAMFGIIATADIIWYFLQGLSTQGMAAKLIHKKIEKENELIEYSVNSLTWQILLSLPITFFIIIFSSKIANFFNSSKLTSVIIVLSISYISMVVKSIPEAVLKKQMQFKILAIRDILFTLLISILSIIFVLLGFGLWSLVIPRVLICPVETISLLILSKIPFKLNFNFRELNQSRKFIGSVSLSYILDYSNKSLDRFVIGKTLGETAIGIYSVASQWSQIMTQNVLYAVNNVMFPLLAKSKHNLQICQSVVKTSVHRLFFISAPTLLGLYVIAPEFIKTLYGEKWVNAITPFRILLIHTLRKVITSPINSIPLAFGCPEKYLIIDLLFFPIYPIAFWYGSKYYGISGVALALLITQWIMVSFKIQISFKLLKLDKKEIFSDLKGILISSLGMIVIIILIKKLFLNFKIFQILVMEVILGILSYSLFIYILSRNDFEWVIKQIKNVKYQFFRKNIEINAVS